MSTQTTTTLLGPPELYKPPLPMGFTENSSRTYLSTGNTCLDFFLHVVPDTPSETLIHRLQLAWNHDPLKTLKLICNLRGVRGTGKLDKQGYYTAAHWLHANHPKTLACNVGCMANFGYFKDLPEILFRLLEGSDARKLTKKIHVTPILSSRSRPMKRTRVEYVKLSDEDENLSREEKEIKRAKKAIERFNLDPCFRYLHERVSDFFAECLRKDTLLLNSAESLYDLSLAAKWCPSLDSSYDQYTLLCETIAKKVFPREEYVGVEEAHYAYRVRDRLRKQVLVPLRKALELPEVYIGANDWGSLLYNRVPSVAMKLYKEHFLKHDKERFEAGKNAEVVQVFDYYRNFGAT